MASRHRIIGLTSGGDLGFPEEVTRGAATAAQVNHTMSAALELARFGVIWRAVVQSALPGTAGVQGTDLMNIGAVLEHYASSQRDT